MLCQPKVADTAIKSRAAIRRRMPRVNTDLCGLRPACNRNTHLLECMRNPQGDILVPWRSDDLHANRKRRKRQRYGNDGKTDEGYGLGVHADIWPQGKPGRTED